MDQRQTNKGGLAVRSRRDPLFVRMFGAFLAAGLAVVVIPIVIGAWPGGQDEGVPHEAMPKTWPLLGNTAVASLCVGVLATLIGAIVAWKARGVGRRLIAVMFLPLALPPYLAYAGWGVLRAPGRVLGDWVGSLPGARAGEVGHLVDMVFAVLGLTLWAWPLAAVIIGASVRRLDRDLMSMIAHEHRGWLSKGSLIGRTVAPGIGASIVLIGLLVAGTAIPFHLANVPTLAIKVWLLLDRLPPEQMWRAYAAAWPLWLMAAAAGWWIGGRAIAWANGPRASEGRAVEVARVWPGRAVLGSAVLVSVGVPAWLLVGSVRDPASFLRFWTVSGDAAAHSAAVAMLTGGVGMVIAAMVAACASISRRSGGCAATALFVRGMVMTGLAPGVLVGAGMVTGWNRIDQTGVVSSSMAIEVLAHIARLGWVGAFTGCVLARLEHPNLCDLRRLEGGESLRGYARTGLLLNLPVLLATGIATALLSFTEIEASIVVSPPGPGNLARQILNYLHFARMEEMSAAAGWIVGVGILCVIGVGWLGGARSRFELAGGGSS